MPGYGIAPISASQDTAGPMDRTVANAAMTLQSIAGYDAAQRRLLHGHLGPGRPRRGDHPARPGDGPELHVARWTLNFVRGKRIGYNGTLTDGTPLKQAYDALVAGGAIMVERPNISPAGMPGGVLGYEAKRDIGSYYRHLGPDAPIKTVEQEMADNAANAQEALKFGNGTHASAFAIDITPDSPASVAYRNDVLVGKRLAPLRDRPDDDQRHARRPERRLHRDPRQRLQRRPRRLPAADDPDGLQRRPSGAR